MIQTALEFFFFNTSNEPSEEMGFTPVEAVFALMSVPRLM